MAASRRRVLFSNSFAGTELRTAASSDLLLYISRHVIEEAVAAGAALRVIPVKELVWLRPVGVIRRKESYVPPAVGRSHENSRNGIQANESAGSLTWRGARMLPAVVGLRPALAKFYAALNDEQKARFNRTLLTGDRRTG